MATAASNVQVKFTLRGEDKASATINKAGRASDNASSSFAKLGKAALAAGAGMAAVGASVEAVKRLAEMTAETERLRASMDAVFGPDGLQVAIDTAREIGGVGAQSVAKLARTIEAAGIQGAVTVEQMQKITQLGTKMGITGDEALSRFADAIAKGNTRALQQVGIFINAGRIQDEYAKSLGITTTQLTQAEKSQLVFNAALKAAEQQTGAATDAYGKNDNALARLDNAWIELKAQISGAVSGPLSDVIEAIASVIEWSTRWGEVILRLIDVITKPFRAANQQMVIGLQAVGKALRAVSEGRFGDLRSVLSEFNRETLANLSTIEVSVRRLGKAFDEALTKKVGRAVASVGGFVGPRMPADIARQQARGRRRGGRRRGRRGPTEAQRIDEQLQDEALAELEAEQEKVKKMADLDAWLADNRINNIMRESLARQAAAEKEKQIEKDRRDERLRTASVSIQAADALFGALIQNEKALAPIKLAMTIGESALAFLRARTPAEQVAAVAAGAVGVAQFAAVMGGGGGAGGLPSVGGAATGPATVGAGAGGGGGGRVVNVTFGNGVVLGNPHEVARTIKGALAVSQGTGF